MPSTTPPADNASSVNYTAPPLPEQKEERSAAGSPVTDEEAQVKEGAKGEGSVQYGWRFWAIFPALCLTACLSAMEGTVITTALPSIARELALADNYVWVANGFFIAGYGTRDTVYDPFTGQTLRQTLISLQCSDDSPLWPIGEYLRQTMGHDQRSLDLYPR